MIGLLAIRYGPSLEFEEAGVAYPGKAQAVLAIRLPREAVKALKTAHRRTGKSFSDIGERLVRECAPLMTDWPTMA